MRRFIGSTVLAAVVCAGCAGYSFVQANAGSLRGGVVPAGQQAPVSTPTPAEDTP